MVFFCKYHAWSSKKLVTYYWDLALQLVGIISEKYFARLKMILLWHNFIYLEMHPVFKYLKKIHIFKLVTCK